MFGRFTLDTSVDFLFGAQVDSLKMAIEPPPSSNGSAKPKNTDRGSSLPFVTAFNEVQRTVTRRLKLGTIWPLFELFGDKTAPQMKVINVSFLRGFLERRKGNRRARADEIETRFLLRLLGFHSTYPGKGSGQEES